MKGMTAFACMSDLDLDLIEESMSLFTPTAAPLVRGRRADTALSRFFGSGWGVAVLCAAVSISVLVAIVLAGRGGWVTPPPPDTVESETTEKEWEEPTEPDGETDTGEDTDGTVETPAETEGDTEPATEGVLHPDVTVGGVLFISQGDGTCKIKGADRTYAGEILVPEKSPYGDTVTAVAAGAFKGFKSVTAVTLPETVTIIKGSAFQGCSSLKTVTLPKRVTEFGRAMFDMCGELTAVVLPLGVTEIPAMTFQTCVSLQRVEARDTITAIGACAFNGCRSLGTLTLPKGGLKSVGSQAFLNCCGLHTVYYGGSRQEWDGVEIHPTDNSRFEYVNVVFTGEE